MDAVKQCYSTMKRFGGVLLGDVVGLGKTVVGMLLIRHFLENAESLGRPAKVLIVTPPAIKSAWKETIDEFQELLYYEYGLVAQTWNGDGVKPHPPDIRNGQCPILFLDYGYQGNLPYGMMRSGGIYIDVLSSYEKERRIIKKCSNISYMSPLKYLDTIVKSGYDKLVNQAKIRT